MSSTRLAAFAAASSVFALVTACGSSGGGSANSSAPAASSPPAASASSSASAPSVAGIWTGTNTVSGVTTKSYVLSQPNGVFMDLGINESNNCSIIGVGNVQASGDDFTGTAKVVVASYGVGVPGLNTGCALSDGRGSISGTEQLTGTLTPGVSFTDTSIVTTAAGVTLPSVTGTMTLSPVYAEPGTLAKLSGNWLGATGQVLAIDANGGAYAQDPSSGCVMNGQFTVSDPAHDLYSLTASYSNCTGTAAVLNGVSVLGVAYVDDTVSPAKLIGGVYASEDDLLVALAAVATKQ